MNQLNELMARQILWQAGQIPDALAYQGKEMWIQGLQDAREGKPSIVRGPVDYQGMRYLEGYKQGMEERRAINETINACNL